MITCGAGPCQGAIADAAPGLSWKAPAVPGWDGANSPDTHSRKVIQSRRRLSIQASAGLPGRLIDDRDSHLDPFVWQVVLAPRRTHDLVRHVHAADHLAKDGVLAVQERRVLHHDEELR